MIYIEDIGIRIEFNFQDDYEQAMRYIASNRTFIKENTIENRLAI